MQQQIQNDLKSGLAVYWTLAEDTALHGQLAGLAAWCLDALRQGGKILFAGNGGSFADSQHRAVEVCVPAAILPCTVAFHCACHQ